jgi:hypothetical protein
LRSLLTAFYYAALRRVHRVLHQQRKLIAVRFFLPSCAQSSDTIDSVSLNTKNKSLETNGNDVIGAIGTSFV